MKYRNVLNLTFAL